MSVARPGRGQHRRRLASLGAAHEPGRHGGKALLPLVPPMCFSATSKLDPTGSGIAISRVNVFNYAGFVLGAALVGGIAGGLGGPAGWRAAYAAPLVLTVVIIALAAGFEPGRARDPRSGMASTAEAGSAAQGSPSTG